MATAREDPTEVIAREDPTTEVIPESAAAAAAATAATAATTTTAVVAPEASRKRSRAAAARVTVNLPDDMVVSLKELAERDGKTFTQALKEAISLKLFVAELFEQRAKLLVQYPDKSVERILFH